jgi:DNA-binding SARP family transcriptional activator/tetratricopeptide (TPR) repeat protein
VGSSEALPSAIVALQISAFGTFRVLRDGAVLDLSGRLPAELLALLVHAEGRVVDHDVLADRLWRGHPPVSARATLQGYVARLRRALEPGRSARAATLLVTRGDGYALEADRSMVDVHRFADLVAATRRTAVVDGGLEATVDSLEQALALWTGDPFAAIADILEVAPHVARLEELRLLAVEELAAANLALGRGAAQVPELAALAALHPLRERLQVLLARAMYAGGRQVDALEALRGTRIRMAEELGLDASPELRELETAILNQQVETPAPAARAPSPGPDRGSTDPGFTGRYRELDVLADAWRLAQDGRGGVVVITGEPGIGKTRLVESFGRTTGAPTRWARCLQTAGVPPYWPWQQVLGGLPDISDASDAGARFAVGMEVARRLRARAEEAPEVVVLDDVQWADPDSLHVLQIVIGLVADMRLLLVLTCREGHAADPALATLLTSATRGTTGHRLALEPLSAAEVAELVTHVREHTDGSPSLAVDEIVRRSGGNPLFAGELARLGRDLAGRVPAVARDAIRLRVTGLSETGQDLIALLSVAGRELPVGLVSAALPRPPADVDEALVASTATGLVQEAVPGRVQIRHDLVRETVLADLGPRRRAELHSALADVLEASPGAVTSLAAIAVHRSEAAGGAADLAAATRCCEAAREALTRAGEAEAADLALRGLGHVPSTGADDLHGDLLHLRGAALRRLGLLEASAEALSEAAAIARRTGDHDRLAQAALTAAGGGMGGYWSLVIAPAVVDVSTLEEAVEHADSLEPDVRSDVLAALAVHRAAVGVAAVDLADAAERASPSPRAAVAGFVTRWTPRSAPERLLRARALLQQCRGRAVPEATALHLLRCALTENLHAEEAAAVGARFTAAVERRGDGDLVLSDLWVRAGQALAEGRNDDARELADRAVEFAPAASPSAADVIRVSRQTIEGIIAWHERRLADVVPEVVDLAATVDPDWLTVVALAHAQAGRREECLAAADRVLQHAGAGVRETVHTILLADAYIELGDADRAASLLPTLEAYGDTAVVLWPGMTFLGPVSLYRGGIRSVLGLPDAEADLRRALEASRRFGYEPFRRRAEALLDTV